MFLISARNCVNARRRGTKESAHNWNPIDFPAEINFPNDFPSNVFSFSQVDYWFSLLVFSKIYLLNQKSFFPNQESHLCQIRKTFFTLPENLSHTPNVLWASVSYLWKFTLRLSSKTSQCDVALRVRVVLKVQILILSR